MATVEELLLRIEADVKGALKGIDQATNKVGAFSDRLKTAGATMSQTGRAATIGLSAPIVAGVGLAAKAAIDYESAFAGVRKTVNATEEEFEALSDGIRAMSKELPASAVEIAGVAEVAGQLGVAQEDILAFTRTMVDLGETTVLSAEQAALSLARFQNIMGTAPEDIGRVGSAIVALGNNLATQEDQIVEYASRISGAGKLAGLAESDILAIGAAMSSVGVQAEAGGTAVQKVLLSMTAAMQDTGEAIDNTAAIASEAAKLEGLEAQLLRAQERLEDLSKGASQVDIDVAKIRVEELTAKLEDSKKEFGENSLQARKLEADLAKAQQRLDNLSAGPAASDLALAEASITKLVAKIDESRNALNSLQSLDGQQSDAILAQFANTAGVTVEEFRRLFEEDAAGAFQAFVEGLGAQGDKAFGTLEGLQLADQRLQRAFLSLAGAGDLLSDSLEIGSAAFEENTALAAEADQRYQTTAAKLEAFRDTVLDAAIELGDALLPALIDVIEASQPLIDGISKAANWFSNLEDENKKVVLVFAAFLVALGPVLTILGALTTAISGVAAALGFLAANPIVLIIIAIVALVAAIVIAIKHWDELKVMAGEAWDWIKRKWVEAGVWFFRVMMGVKDAIVGVFKGAVNAVINLAQYGFFGPLALLFTKRGRDIAWDLANGLINGIKNATSAVKDSIKGMGEKAVNGLKDFLGIKSPSRVFMAIGAFSMDGLVEGIQHGETQATRALDDVATRLSSTGIQVPVGIQVPRVGDVNGRGFTSLRGEGGPSQVTLNGDVIFDAKGHDDPEALFQAFLDFMRRPGPGGSPFA